MINTAAVSMDALNQEHPERAEWKYAYADYQLLYEGGLRFKRAAGQGATTIASATSGGSSVIDYMAQRNRRRRFLFQLEGEPDTKYISRWERAYYIPYIAAIVDYFRHWLFSQPPAIRPKIQDPEAKDAQPEDPPEWWDDFSRDATGNGTSFLDAAKQSFGDVLIYRRAGWLIGAPDRAPTEDGSKDVCLTLYNAQEISDWQEDAEGKLEWILLSKKTTRREFPDKRFEVEIRTYVDRDSWAAWEIVIDPKTNQQQPTLIAEATHSLGEVPFEWMTVPEGLWVMNKLASWQVDLFNQMSMLSYSQLVACFLQPYLVSQDGTDDSTNRIMGEGILFTLKASDGDRGEEKFGWAAPPTEPLEFNAKRILEQRDEGYRIVHQMSLAVDSQAIGAIARSGASKIEDRKATEIILCAFGGYVRDFMLRTLDKISRILGDNTEWVIDGYDNFEVSSMQEEMEIAALAQTFNIQSPTFNAELQKMIGTGRVLGHLDEALKAKIRNEIDEHTAQKAELVTMGPTQVNPVTGQPMSPEPEPPKE